MRILEYRSIGGRDFHATMECEHCGGTQEIKTGYNDVYYHQHVIPAMTCKACGKNRAGEIPAESNDYGMKPVAARTEPVVQELEQARADAARMRHALEEATRALAVDPRFLSPARLETARSILAAALAEQAPDATPRESEAGVMCWICLGKGKVRGVSYPEPCPNLHCPHRSHR